MCVITKSESSEVLISTAIQYFDTYEQSINANGGLSADIEQILSLKGLAKKDKTLSIASLAVYAYYMMSMYAPDLVAMLYDNAKNAPWVRKARNFTTKYISPLIFDHTVRTLKKKQRDLLGDVEIVDSRAELKVSAKFDIDDCSIYLIFEIPPCYPLQRISVLSNTFDRRRNQGTRKKQKAVSFRPTKVSDNNWKEIMSNVENTVKVNNGRIDDALASFTRNVVSYIKGLNPCSICKCFMLFVCAGK